MESKNNLYNKLLKEYLSINTLSIKKNNIKPDTVKPDTVKPDTVKPDTVKSTIESDINLSEIFTKELNKPKSLSNNVKISENYQVDEENNSMKTSEIELSEIYTDKETSKNDNLILVNENIQSIFSQEPETKEIKPETKEIKPETKEIKPEIKSEIKPIATTSTLGITLITPPPLLTKSLTPQPINLNVTSKPPGFTKESGEELLRSLGIAQSVKSQPITQQVTQPGLPKNLDVQTVLKQDNSESKPQTKITPTLLPPSLQMAFKSFKGGMSVELFDNVFDENQPTLKYIMSYYFKHYREQIDSKIIPKILNNNEIIMVMVSCLYAYFIEKKYTKIDEIINIEFISSIPEHFTFNFLNLINQQLEQSSETQKIKKYLDEMSIRLKNDIYSRIYLKEIHSELLKYDPEDYTINVAILKQNGGGKIDISVKINNKINKLSESLKKQSKQTGGKNSLFHSITHEINKYVKLIKDVTKYHKQIGGNLITDIKDQKQQADEQLKKISDDVQRVKIHKQKIVEKANMWSIQLVNENFAIKTIEDNDYGIARFVLVPTKDYEKDLEFLAILTFINGTASILTFKNEPTSDAFPEVLKVEKLGPAQPTYITDKLTTYFEKKYIELQKLKEDNNRQKDGELKKEEGIFEQLKKFLGFRGGSDGELKIPEGSDNFLEYCFTSRQYNKFLQKMEGYLKANGKTIEIEELKSLKDEIEQVKKIEDKLVELNKLLINYKLINDQFPDFITKDVTVQHMKSILKSNDSLIDGYGNVNLDILQTVKNIEKLILLKEGINEENKQKFSQSGGHIESKNFSKKYMGCNDYKFFISDKMKEVLEKINNGDNEKNK